MPSTCELVFYAFVNYVPYTFLALYPFKDALRYSKTITGVLFIVFSSLQIAIFVAGYYMGPLISRYSSYFIILICIVFYFVAVKSRTGRMLFNLFMIKNIADFIVVEAKFLEGRFFPDSIGSLYCWTNSLCLSVVTLITFIPITLLVKAYFSKRIRDLINPKIWMMLCLVPITFYIIWQFIFYYSTTETPLEIALKLRTSIFMLLFISGQILVYICIARMVINFEETLLLEEHNHQLESQTLQYQSIKEHIKEISALKHDMRHHLNVMCHYADNKDYDALTRYLHEYEITVPSSRISYCGNVPLNMLLVYYHQRCEEESIQLDINLGFPDNLNLRDSDLAIIFGNLMENAFDACKAIKGTEKYIKLNGKVLQKKFVCTLVNSFENSISKDSQGVLLSTKHAGPGIGCESVRRIVSKYSGTTEFNSSDSEFKVSLIIPLT